MPEPTPVAIVGMAAIFPGAPDLRHLLAEHRRRRGRDQRRAGGPLGRVLLRPGGGRHGRRRPVLLPARRVRRRAGGLRPDPVRHHAGRGRGRRARSAARAPGRGRRDRRRGRRGTARRPAPGRRDRRARRLPHPRHRPAGPARPHRAPARREPARTRAWPRRGRAGPGARRVPGAARTGAAGVLDRAGAEPRRLPDRQPARPARPGVHRGRGVRLLAGRGRPGGAPSWRPGGATPCSRAACTTATT